MRAAENKYTQQLGASEREKERYLRRAWARREQKLQLNLSKVDLCDDRKHERNTISDVWVGETLDEMNAYSSL